MLSVNSNSGSDSKWGVFNALCVLSASNKNLELEITNIACPCIINTKHNLYKVENYCHNEPICTKSPIVWPTTISDS
mgnify:FL=1